MTCGKCGSMSKIKMYKTAPTKGSKEVVPKKIKESERNLMSPSLALPSSKKGKRKSRDLTAGLTLYVDEEVSVAITNSHSSADINNAQSGNAGSHPRKRQISAFQKQKEMNNLKKMLFHSKKAKKSGSSLQDFLSGI